MTEPGVPYTERTPRVAAARQLLRRRARERAGRFLVEGVQAVREALSCGSVLELFVTERAATRHPDLLDAPGARVSLITERAAAGLSGTATPQGVVAVCAALGRPAADVTGGTRLVAVLADVADPGNAGTVIRVADAAGAGAVLFAGDTVDPHNGKCVRASTGSLFHVAVGVEPDPRLALAACRRAGLQVLAADAGAGRDLDDVLDAGTLVAPTAWLFGNEAQGLDRELLAAADHAVAVPLHGRAESLNLATAAAVCLYASARAHRRPRSPRTDHLGSGHN
ncbi:MAG: RNA methyltransferase [Pseudonocardiales bacterium]|nr:RNA methyltransferase [Pseudonocardiales bacterium]MBV9031113.1 RNA methyltransferase [Pseudonocardiales bacterium]MBW0009210.1 RNA methyltransferase [Pseudonocardiales bacterium]